MFAERCRNRSPLDRATYCEVKEGRIAGGDFARLARLIERSGYYSFAPGYERSVTHAALEITSVTRSGKTHQVSDYAAAGPLELWGIRKAIAGTTEAAAWEKTGRQPSCPPRAEWPL
jgi:hypothetical protein